MADKLTVKLNSAGIRELLKSAEIQSVCKEQASNIANRCGAGYESDVRAGKNRAVAEVKAVTYAAKRDNLKNNTLLKAVKG